MENQRDDLGSSSREELNRPGIPFFGAIVQLQPLPWDDSIFDIITERGWLATLPPPHNKTPNVFLSVTCRITRASLAHAR